MWDESEVKNQNNAQRHSPGPLPIDWQYLRPTLVFAGHYLQYIVGQWKKRIKLENKCGTLAIYQASTDE